MKHSIKIDHCCRCGDTGAWCETCGHPDCDAMIDAGITDRLAVSGHPAWGHRGVVCEDCEEAIDPLDHPDGDIGAWWSGSWSPDYSSKERIIARRVP